jgi:hypothetical protein
MPPGHIQNQEVDEDDREELEPQLRWGLYLRRSPDYSIGSRRHRH